MYVWFDALVNYISTLGWGSDNTQEFKDFWPGIQVAGKDNLRQQTAMWQAMLMSAGILNSKQVFIHGFVTSGGQKMSKTMGNVVDPFEIKEKYGTDALRYFLLGGMNSYEDGDFTIERFEEFYTAHLVNGVGNLTSRILTMLENYSDGKIIEEVKSEKLKVKSEELWIEYYKNLSKYDFEKAVVIINDFVKILDKIIDEEKPWIKFKEGKDVSGVLYELAEGLRHLGLALLPIIPETAEKILNSLGIENVDRLNLAEEKEWGRLKSGTKVKKPESLFPRLQK
jgi:methionyl-tRNA synthetase